MSVYVQIMDHIAKDKRNNLAGQISLFDIAEESQKEEFDIRMPDVGEYPAEMRLAFEKEVLGIYISGHPLQSDQALLEKHITNTTSDFALDEEEKKVRVADQASVIVGGMIADKNIKYTKNDKVMAFLNLEDLVGNVEVVVFPRDYEQYGSLLMEDARIFIRGRANVEEEKDGKIICEQIVSFDEARKAGNGPIFRGRYGRFGGNGFQGRGNSYGGNGFDGGNGSYGRENSGQNGQAGREAPVVSGRRTVPAGIWVQFSDAADYFAREQELLSAIADSDGNDDVVIYLKDSRSYKLLPPNRRVKADRELEELLGGKFGRENVKIR